MTAIQILLGDILRRRINSELKKDKTIQDFTSIEEAIDIFIADGKLTMEQYAEFKGLITPVATAS